MIQFAWRFLRFQKDSALAQWFAARTADKRASTRKTMIVALARKLLIALWRLATSGEVSDGIALRPEKRQQSKGKDNRTTNLATPC
jgi:transposase